MNRAEICNLQQRIGAEPDGFWGPKSVEACQKYLRKFLTGPSPWPKTDQASLQKFYGSPGDESQHATISVSGLGLKYDGKPVQKITCHKKVADSLLRILTALSKFPEGQEALAGYAGVYNNRPMRGGSTPSLHARAAAIDLNPDANGNKVHWPTSATMPIEVMEVFAGEGWMPAGAFWSRDAMHFQATQ